MRLKFLWSSLFLLLMVGYATAQVTGKVEDEYGPLVGAMVSIDGTKNVTETSDKGEFSIPGNVGDKLKIINPTTLNEKIFPVKKLNMGVLKLTDKEVNLDVVVAFGKQKKENLTGSVSVVSSKDLEGRPVSNVTEALQGVMPGLNVFSSNAGGQLDARKSINIRGSGTIGKGSNAGPLVLIDGMEGNINALNPDDVESISVLKDAAASSIYGSRAPFGVILITTKKGKAGKVEVNYRSSLRFDSPIIRPKMLDSYSWALFFNDAQVGADPFSAEKLQQIKDFQDGKVKEFAFPSPAGDKWFFWTTGKGGPVANTNWIEEHYKKVAMSQEHNLSVSGGTDKSQYYVSMNYLNRDGLFRYADEDFSRYTLTGKINAKLSNMVSIGYSSRFVRENYEAPTYLSHNSVFFHDIIRYWPIIPLKDPNGFFTVESKVPYLRDGGRRRNQTDWLYNQLSATVNFTDNWDLKTEFNYRSTTTVSHSHTLTTYGHGVDKSLFALEPSTSSVWEGRYINNFYNTNIYSNYYLDLESGHHFKLIGGFQAELFKNNSLGGSRQNIIVPEKPTLNTTANKDEKITEGGYGHWATAGFFGRLNYNYKGKYLLELNGRVDGTSRFLRDKRWNFFPSVSAGWNIAKEDFWLPLKETIGELKLRGSWGELGNQNTSSWYPFYQSIGYHPNAGRWVLGERRPTVSTIPGLVSGLLTWERIRSWDAGIDVSAFRNRLGVSFDYFKRFTIDMVGPAPELPPTLGTAPAVLNNADMVSYGFELGVNWRDNIGKDFNYGVGFQLTDSRQEILKYPNPSMAINNWYEGRYMGEIWGFTTIGIAKSQEEMDAHLAKVNQNSLGSNWSAGDIMYADINGDGEISRGEARVGNSGDYTIIGNSTSRYNFGLTLDAAYKGFDFKVFLQGVGKRDFMPGGSYFWGANGGMWQTLGFEQHLDYFRDDPKHPFGLNKDSYYPRLDWGSGKNKQSQTRYLQDASYLRVKNIQLGYSLSKDLLKRVGVSNLRIYVSGENIATFTKLSKLYDPEMVGIGYGGEGAKTYPLSKTWAVGLSITL